MGMHNPFKHNRWKDDIFGRKKRARQNTKALKNSIKGLKNTINSLDRLSTVASDRRLFELTHGKSRMEFGNNRSYL